MNRSETTQDAYDSDDVKHNAPAEPAAFASLSLHQRMILVAQMAVQAHLAADAAEAADAAYAASNVEHDEQRRNRQQAKRATTDQFDIGGAGGIDQGPAWVTVTEDPALAPLTPPSAPDQANPLRKLVNRRLRLRDSHRDDNHGGAAA
jgi:hypothetical protein